MKATKRDKQEQQPKAKSKNKENQMARRKFAELEANEVVSTEALKKIVGGGGRFSGRSVLG